MVGSLGHPDIAPIQGKHPLFQPTDYTADCPLPDILFQIHQYQLPSNISKFETPSQAMARAYTGTIYFLVSKEGSPRLVTNLNARYIIAIGTRIAVPTKNYYGGRGLLLLVYTAVFMFCCFRSYCWERGERREKGARRLQ